MARTVQASRAVTHTIWDILLTSRSSGLNSIPEPPVMLSKLFERLGATYVKLGKYIASSPLLFPSEYVLEFQSKNEEQFRQFLVDQNLDSVATAPKVFSEFTTKKVLTMEYLDGVSLLSKYSILQQPFCSSVCTRAIMGLLQRLGRDWDEIQY